MSEAKRELLGQDKSEFNVWFVPVALDDSDLSAAEFRVYAHLARRSNKGRAWPGIDSMAKVCRINKSTVIESIRVLEKRGMMLVKRGGRKGNVYILTRQSSWVVPKLPTDRSEIGNVPNEGTVLVGNRERKVIQEGTPNSPQGCGGDVIHNGEAPESPHTTFIKLWMESYSEHFGCAYAFQRGKDAKSVQHLLASTKLSPGELIAIAKAAWAKGTGFYCKSAASITGFNSKFNEIRHELKNGTDKKATTAGNRNAGTANEGKSSQYKGVGKVRVVPDAGRPAANPDEG